MIFRIIVTTAAVITVTIKPINYSYQHASRKEVHRLYSGIED